MIVSFESHCTFLTKSLRKADNSTFVDFFLSLHQQNGIVPDESRYVEIYWHIVSSTWHFHNSNLFVSLNNPLTTIAGSLSTTLTNNSQKFAPNFMKEKTAFKWGRPINYMTMALSHRIQVKERSQKLNSKQRKMKNSITKRKPFGGKKPTETRVLNGANNKKSVRIHLACQRTYCNDYNHFFVCVFGCYHNEAP